jgi:aspartate/methionine/tyrosine aminotransferase
MRSAVSNVPQLSQTLVAKALASPAIAAERAEKNETLRRRAERVYEVARAPRFRESWTVYPFNSGYFMCVRARRGRGRAVRLHLLDQYGIGTIATEATISGSRSRASRSTGGGAVRDAPPRVQELRST